MCEPDYSAAETAQLLRTPYATLRRWLDQGCLPGDAPGAGAPRRFSFREVALLFLVRDLRDHDLPLPLVRRTVALADRAWQGDDPAHAGYVMLRLGDGGAANGICATAFDTLANFIAVQPAAPGYLPASALVFVDLTFFARRVAVRIEEIQTTL